MADTTKPEGGAERGQDVPRARDLPRVEGYELLGELGRGGMGVVYRARQVKLNRLVALKMVLAGEHSSQTARTRFLQEAELAARLQHPNIVQIHELGEHEGLPFFAMEHVTGGPLRRLLAGQPGEFAGLARLFEKLARAVHAAHQQGVVHRDLKPANVLMTPEGEPKITDFGLAKRLDPDGSEPALTLTGMALGTPAYMAPEQAAGTAKSVGPPADIYALGVMLYEMLSGELPLTGTTEMDTLQRIVHEEPPSPAWKRPEIPRDLETICMKCLRKNPADRYASAADLADDLRRFIQGEPIVARPVSRITKAVRWGRKHPLVPGLVVAAMLAAGFWWRYQVLYVRESVEVFPNFAKLWGEFRGLGPPLTAEQTHGRAVSYKIVRQGTRGHTLRVECIDGWGKLTPRHILGPGIAGLFDRIPQWRRECVFRLAYKDDGSVDEETGVDVEGHPLWRFKVLTATTPGAGAPKILDGFFLDPESVTMKTSGGVSRMHIERDDRGRDQMLSFLDENKKARKANGGVFKQAVVYSDSNEIAEIRNLDEQGALMNNDAGWAVRTVAWQGVGRLKEDRYFDRDGKPALVEGVHRVTYDYDAPGNEVRESFFDDQGKPARQKRLKVRELSTTFDAHGRQERFTTSGWDEEVEGCAQVTSVRQWNDDGSCRDTVTRFDALGNPVRHKSGARTITADFDTKGRILRQVFADCDPRQHGYASMTRVNVWGDGLYPKETIETYQDQAGKETAHPSGHRQIREDIDDEGRTIRTTNTGYPEKYPYAKMVLEYVFGEGLHMLRTIETWYDKAGEPAPDSLGSTRVERELDDEQRMSRALYSGFDQNRVPYAREIVEYEYAAGRSHDAIAKTTRYEGADGQSVPHPELGCLLRRADLDASGRTIRETWSGFDPGKVSYDREIVDFEYRGTVGPVAKTHHYEDANGKAVRHSTGGHMKRRTEYDDQGRRIRDSKSGYDKESFDPAGISYDTVVTEFTYAGTESPVTQATHYEDANGQPVRDEKGATRAESELDENHRVTRTIYTGFDPSRLYTREVHEFEYGTGRQATAETTRYEDDSGRPVRRPIAGHTTCREEYDAAGYRVRDSRSGYDPARFGFSKRTVDVARDGTAKAVHYEDAEGRPVPNIQAIITGVDPGSTAAAIGLHPGDVLSAYNGQPVTSSILFAFNTTMTGGTVDIIRAGKPMNFQKVPPGKLGIIMEDHTAP